MPPYRCSHVSPSCLPPLKWTVVVLAFVFGFFQSARAQLQRVPNTTLTNLPINAPGYNYTSTNALGTLVFTNPVCLATPPGETNRLFILEKRGRIVVITNLASPTRTVFMDITARVISGSDTDINNEQGLLGLAFHPGYASNGCFYAFYTGNDTTAAGANTRHDILSRFNVSPTDPNQGLADSEVKLIRQRDEASNHNGGDLHFGPDGYLYVSLGDEGGANDSWNNSQLINNDFFSGMLRLDVDQRPGSLAPNPHAGIVVPANYAIPPDNPFVHSNLGGDWNGVFNGTSFTSQLARVRTEFWAVGLRNPWRFSFDPLTGWLFCGDVGQGTREEVDIIRRGGNYGWAYREGTIAGPKAPPAGFTWINPILEYSHSEGISITGGVVYRGNRIAPLYGAYVFADYGGSGRVWFARYNGTNASPRQLMLQDTGISAFGVDPSNGDVLYCDLVGGTNSTIDRIVPAATTGQPFPLNLSATGAFADLATLRPSDGIVPYVLNVPFWSDHALKTRWFSVPDTNSTIGFSREGNWTFPNGSVWIKHFELELTNGVPASRRRLETRFIMRNAEGVYGITYRWGDSLTDATLVPEQGMDEPFVIDQGGGIVRTQVWHYPSRAECLQCHTAAGGFALGFNTAQLNRTQDYGSGPTNQIAALSRAGYFSTDVTGLHTLRALAPASDTNATVEFRARSYLAANCAQCHQPGGTAPTEFNARAEVPLEQTGLLNAAAFNNGGSPANRLVSPGDLFHSVLLSRVAATNGFARMPPLATTELDSSAIALLSEWISGPLTNRQSYADWRFVQFGSTNSIESDPAFDADGDGRSNQEEFLTGTNPQNRQSRLEMQVLLTNAVLSLEFSLPADRSFQVESTTDLLDWSLWDVPGNDGIPRLGGAIRLDGAVSDDQHYFRLRVWEN